ncbi:MAG: hypothetical protein VX653_02960 [Candidatus Thermoplasmatota archaeon]|nr:hypothetical protein [Candidatus Thermoplasmatota archaeon]MEC8954887.1 hypothetical protein [Candidatus Thermoplasmatota archaeon]MEC9350967.1 hypothetical protein [Candidatus Thermoplasmatota archaeon]MEC9478433.1 hypothetical protein [Candidatus Thermoplasmatota archaeon]MED6312781.1 hypothetical protein [Candidatus Thermoplasmatota archaeon]
MLEGSVEQYSISESEKQTSPISMIAGTTALVLILPAVVIALMELLDHLEWSPLSNKWIIYSMVFSLTIISILLISGLYLVGFIKSDNAKMSSGIYLIAISALNLLIRLSYLNEDREMWWGGSWFEFIQNTWVHEQLELAFFGILIGALIMKK